MGSFGPSESSSLFGSIDPKRWGKAAWDTMHWVAAAFPETPSASQQLDARRFFLGLAKVLPCPECQDHFSQVLESHPIDEALKSGSALRQWITDVHNAVNANVGSDQVFTVEQANAKYSILPTATTATTATAKLVSVAQQQRLVQKGLAFTGRSQQSKAMLRSVGGAFPTAGTIVVRRSVPVVKRSTTTTTANAQTKKPKRRGCGCGAR